MVYLSARHGVLAYITTQGIIGDWASAGLPKRRLVAIAASKAVVKRGSKVESAPTTNAAPTRAAAIFSWPRWRRRDGPQVWTRVDKRFQDALFPSTEFGNAAPVSVQRVPRSAQGLTSDIVDIAKGLPHGEPRTECRVLAAAGDL